VDHHNLKSIHKQHWRHLTKQSNKNSLTRERKKKCAAKKSRRPGSKERGFNSPEGSRWAAAGGDCELRLEGSGRQRWSLEAGGRRAPVAVGVVAGARGAWGSGRRRWTLELRPLALEPGRRAADVEGAGSGSTRVDLVDVGRSSDWRRSNPRLRSGALRGRRKAQMAFERREQRCEKHEERVEVKPKPPWLTERRRGKKRPITDGPWTGHEQARGLRVFVPHHL